MTLWVVIEHTPYEGSELLGVWATFNEARDQIESGQELARESAAAGTYKTEWLYRHPVIEEWTGGKCEARWENMPGTPLWESEFVGETR